jgi:hypothetical protein
MSYGLTVQVSVEHKHYFHLWGLRKSLVASPPVIFSIAPLVKTTLVVRFCYHRTIPMMRFSAYYVSTIGCNSNLCVNFETLCHIVSEKSLFLLHRKKVFL